MYQIAVFPYFTTIAISMQFRWSVQFWDHFGVVFGAIPGRFPTSLLAPPFERNIRKTKGFGTFAGSLGVPFWGTLSEHFGARLGCISGSPAACKDSLGFRVSLFHSNSYSNSIIGHCRGSEIAPAGAPSILEFSLFQDTLFHNNNSRAPRPA